jgi:MFS family permease
MYPISRRGTIMAWFYAAIPVGSAIGFIVGGLMLSATKRWTGSEDWRWAFFVVVPPGLALAALSFFMREPARGLSDATAPHHATWADYKIIFSTPSFALTTLGYTALTFVQGGVAAWIPRYVHTNRGQPDLDQVNVIFGGIVVVSGLFATLLGGWVGDRLRGRLPGAYLLVSGWGVLLSFPLMLAVLFVAFPYAWIFIFLSVFFMFFNTGPINTVLANVTHPSVRASAFAINIFVIHLFGDVFSPAIMGAIAGFSRNFAASGRVTGWLADTLASCDGMDFSIGLTAILLLVSGLLWLWGARYLERDTALAPTRVAPRDAA